MITQHSVRTIISPPIEPLIKVNQHSPDSDPNKALENPGKIKPNYPLKFNYYRNLINKLYSSEPKKTKK
jgi:hypothetical protein